MKPIESTSEARPRKYSLVTKRVVGPGNTLVMSDYLIDFFELDHLRSTMSLSVIRKLKAHFARYVIPEQLVTDNGLQFSSSDFLKFSNEWDFDHRTSSQWQRRKCCERGQEIKILLKCKKASSDPFLPDHRNVSPTGI